jgi:hypothetical protein
MRWVVVGAILMAAQAVSGCFFYDSRWGQAEEEQRRAAKRQAPVQLSPSGSADGQRKAGGSGGLARRPVSELRTLTLRAYRHAGACRGDRALAEHAR